MPTRASSDAQVQALVGLHLVHGQLSNSSMRVRLLLEEKRLPWTSHLLDATKQDNLSESYLRVNPTSLIPALVHDGVVVTESSDILYHLEERFPEPRFAPVDAAAGSPPCARDRRPASRSARARCVCRGGCSARSFGCARPCAAEAGILGSSPMPNALWTARDLEAANPRTTKLALERAGVVASFRDVLDAWGTDPAFCGWFGDQLAASTFSAFKWETPPVRDESLDQPFELVLLDAPMLARAPDPDAFAEHFADPRRGDVLAFENLGGDAMMVVPRPLAAPDAYGHLAAFVRSAPEAQRRELWRVVSAAMAARVGARPVWLSTAGGGVSWLHVRLDSRPKYHGHAPYRDADGRRRT